MKKTVIILGILACLFTFDLTAQNAATKVDLKKNVFTLEPGKSFVLSGKMTVPKGVKPQVWSVYAYFPNTPAQFRHKCKLPIVNPRSAWGLVRIIKHTPMVHILRKDGSFHVTVSTKNWGPGCYALAFSCGFYDTATKKHFSRISTVYVVIEK